MARKTDEIFSEGWVGDKADDYLGIRFPDGVDKSKVGTSTGQWYAYQRTYKDGTKETQWFKRGSGGGAGGTGDAVAATTEQEIPDIAKAWGESQKPAPTVTIGGVPNVVVGKDPTTGQDIYGPVQTTTGPAAATATTAAGQTVQIEGTPDPSHPSGFDNERPVKVTRDKDGKQIGLAVPLQGKDLEDWRTDREKSRNPGNKSDAEIAAEAKATAAANKPTIAPSQAGRPAVQYVPDPDNPGQVKAVPIPGAQAAPEAPAEAVSAPSDQMWIVRQRPGQPPEFVKNPNYVKPSRIMPDPGDPTKLVNITHDDNGNVISVPVTGTTVIKPADLPVLQAKYGTIASSLGALAQDLNSRYARGEITEKQKNDAFTAAHQQASTQVAEINSILDTSKAIWSGELTQRGQSLQETQSRRSYASGIFDRAAATGMGIATSAGPGHGKAIAAGVGALMNIGQQYAQGMGGFTESPEIPLPAALQQARGISLPGYGGAPGAQSGPPGVPPGAPPGAPPPAGGPGAARAGLPAPLLRPPPPVTGSVAAPVLPAGGPPPPVPLPGAVVPPGAPPPVPLPSAPAPSGGLPGYGDPGFFRPDMQGPDRTDPGFFRPDMQGPDTTDPGFYRDMGARLQGAQAYSGAPVAAGGAGLWDPTNDVAQMIGDGADPTWAEAVRQAAATVSQPGYAWSRFTQPASRFG